MAKPQPSRRERPPPRPQPFDSTLRPSQINTTKQFDMKGSRQTSSKSSIVQQILSRIGLSYTTSNTIATTPDTTNPARGIRAAQKAVRTGVLDKRYRGAATRVTAVIVALPIAIVTSWELWQRRFAGKEKKALGQSSEGQEDETAFGAISPTTKLDPA